MLLNPADTLAWPNSFSPHATTVPSLTNARLCPLPVAMATTLLKPVGTAVSPMTELTPHAITVPSAFKATLCRLPQLTATTLLNPPGTSDSP